MAKETIQEGLLETDALEPRKLNMEEKRKLEKLLLSDIDSAVARYNARAADMRQALVDKLKKNLPAEAKRLLASYLLAKKQQEQLESKLNALGYDIAYDDSLDDLPESFGRATRKLYHCGSQ